MVLLYQIWILFIISKYRLRINITDRWRSIVQWMGSFITRKPRLAIRRMSLELQTQWIQWCSRKMWATTESDLKVANKTVWWSRTKINESRLIESSLFHMISPLLPESIKCKAHMLQLWVKSTLMNSSMKMLIQLVPVDSQDVRLAKCQETIRTTWLCRRTFLKTHRFHLAIDKFHRVYLLW